MLKTLTLAQMSPESARKRVNVSRDSLSEIAVATEISPGQFLLSSATALKRSVENAENIHTSGILAQCLEALLDKPPAPKSEYNP